MDHSDTDDLFEWDAVTGKRVRALNLRRIPFRGFAQARDAKTFATTHEDGKIGLWSHGGSHPHHVIDTGKPAGEAIALSSDGTLLAVATSTQVVELWDHDGTSPRKVLPVERVRSLDFSPDGRTLACALRDNRVKLFHVPSGQELMTLLPETIVHCVRFSPDGQTLLISGGGLLQALEAPRKTRTRD